jgi:hypothetical protein
MTMTNPADEAVKIILQEQWARDLSVRINWLRCQLNIARAERKAESLGLPQEMQESAKGVSEFLDQAEDAIQRRDRFPRGRSPLNHWRGISVVTAYENVHAAEVLLVDLLGPDQVKGLVPSVLARARDTLGVKDPRREYVESLKNAEKQDTVCPVRIKLAMRAGFQAEDQIYLRIRNFRNLVVKCTGLLFALIVVMVWLVGTHPALMPLCFEPQTGPTATMAFCPSGDNKLPSPEDIVIVVGLGLLGSAAAAAFSIRRIQGIPTPYDIPIALAVFKLPLGAFTAVTGLLLLGGNFVPGLSELDSQRQILAYALTFGYAQQAVSRLVDDQARRIVGGLPAAQRANREARENVSRH